MTLKRKDLDDSQDPNPDRNETTAPGPGSIRIPGRDFAGTEFAAAQARQAEGRNSGPDDRGNRSDDVQASDRSAEGPVHDTDEGDGPDSAAVRVNEARGALDAERGGSNERGTR